MGLAVTSKPDFLVLPSIRIAGRIVAIRDLTVNE